MRAIVKISDTISIQSDEKESEDEVFKQIQSIQAVFEDNQCGKCKSKNVKHVVREAEGFEFFEMHCKNPSCKARLAFGHNKESKKLYPKRCEIEIVGKNKGKAKRDKEGNALWLPDNGWTVYIPKEES